MNASIEASTEDEISQWLEEQDAQAKMEAENRALLERQALRRFSFSHAKFNLRREIYRQAIGA